MTVECLCGGKVKYDSDGSGHEWLTCEQCKFEVETYQSPCVKKVWEDKMLEKSARCGNLEVLQSLDRRK